MPSEKNGTSARTSGHASASARTAEPIHRARGCVQAYALRRRKPPNSGTVPQYAQEAAHWPHTQQAHCASAWKVEPRAVGIARGLRRSGSVVSRLRRAPPLRPPPIRAPWPRVHRPPQAQRRLAVHGPPEHDLRLPHGALRPRRCSCTSHAQAARQALQPPWARAAIRAQRNVLALVGQAPQPALRSSQRQARPPLLQRQLGDSCLGLRCAPSTPAILHAIVHGLIRRMLRRSKGTVGLFSWDRRCRSEVSAGNRPYERCRRPGGSHRAWADRAAPGRVARYARIPRPPARSHAPLLKLGCVLGAHSKNDHFARTRDRQHRVDAPPPRSPGTSPRV